MVGDQVGDLVAVRRDRAHGRRLVLGHVPAVAGDIGAQDCGQATLDSVHGHG